MLRDVAPVSWIFQSSCNDIFGVGHVTCEFQMFGFCGFLEAAYIDSLHEESRRPDTQIRSWEVRKRGYKPILHRISPMRDFIRYWSWLLWTSPLFIIAILWGMVCAFVCPRMLCTKMVIKHQHSVMFHFFAQNFVGGSPLLGNNLIWVRIHVEYHLLGRRAHILVFTDNSQGSKW